MREGQARYIFQSPTTASDTTCLRRDISGLSDDTAIFSRWDHERCCRLSSAVQTKTRDEQQEPTNQTRELNKAGLLSDYQPHLSRICEDLPTEASIAANHELCFAQLHHHQDGSRRETPASAASTFNISSAGQCGVVSLFEGLQCCSDCPFLLLSLTTFPPLIVGTWVSPAAALYLETETPPAEGFCAESREEYFRVVEKGMGRYNLTQKGF